MFKTRIRILIIFLCFLLITNTPVLSQQPGFTCKVTKVKDGDTFKCESGVSIRVWGINTKELKSKDPKEKELAIKAKLELENTILNETLYCVPKGASYNRIVAQCYMLNDLGRYMIDTGLAEEVPFYSKNYYHKTIYLHNHNMIK